MGDSEPSISAVIPALNEENQIGRAVSSCYRGGVREVVVVDGGSDDGTREEAVRRGARVVCSSKGRDKQCQAGLDRATGSVVVFVHADTEVPRSLAKEIACQLSQGRVWGACRLKLEPKGANCFSRNALRLVELGVRVRCWLFAMPYGDQAIFATRRELESVGDIPQIGFMEDFELVRRLRWRSRPGLIPACAVTSSRRWMTLGIFKVIQGFFFFFFWSISLPMYQ